MSTEHCDRCNNHGHYYATPGMVLTTCTHGTSPAGDAPVDEAELPVAPSMDVTTVDVTKDPEPKPRRTKAATGDGTARQTRHNTNDPGSK